MKTIIHLQDKSEKIAGGDIKCGKCGALIEKAGRKVISGHHKVVQEGSEYESNDFQVTCESTY